MCVGILILVVMRATAARRLLLLSLRPVSRIFPLSFRLSQDTFSLLSRLSLVLESYFFPKFALLARFRLRFVAVQDLLFGDFDALFSVNFSG